MSMRLLLLLLENGERTTTRDEIVARLWEGRIVSDDAITKQISKLRAYLGDAPRNPEIIRTIPKVGVRLLIKPELTSSTANIQVSGRRKLALGAMALAMVSACIGFLWMIWPREALREASMTQRPLTSSPGIVFDPSISADGRWLSYVHRSSG